MLCRRRRKAYLLALASKPWTGRSEMKRHSSAFVIGLVAAIVLGFGIVAGVALGLRSIAGLGYEPAVTQATKTGPNTAELDLSTYPDSHVCHADQGEPQINWVTYCSSTNVQGTNLEVPPNSLITVVIKQYDTSTGVLNDFFQKVQGTVGGVAMYNNKPMGQLDSMDIAHTFTIQSQPDETNPIFVSVPLLGVANNAPSAVTINGTSYPKPEVIEFQFRTGPAGHVYIWHCYVPCGSNLEAPYGFSGPMSTTGYMAGTITVSSY
jgi:hypothetical protein